MNVTKDLNNLTLANGGKEDGTATAEVTKQAPQDYGRQDEGSQSVDKALADYFRPILEEYAKKCGSSRSIDEVRITPTLAKNLFAFCWGPDVFKAPRTMLQRIYKEISQVLEVSRDQSDLDDLLVYHPVEVLSCKFSQVLIGIALIEPDLVSKELIRLQNTLEVMKGRLDSSARDAYRFLLEILIQWYEVLSGCKFEGMKLTSDEANPETREKFQGMMFDDLDSQSKSTIYGQRALFMRWFRVKPRARFDLLKKAHEGDVTNVEWLLYLSQSLRMKRREAISTANLSKKPTFEELEFTKLTLQMEPLNPFVRLNVIDSVIDAIREFNGRFNCGQINLWDMDSAMGFLRKECESLCNDFPTNVYLKSTISDYFARYVTYVYFDKNFSGKLLEDAYDLNPKDPRTTHRLGIFHRMNMKNMSESLKWLEKTLELDPSHFNGNMDYFRMILGNPDKNPDVGQKMEELLTLEASTSWKPNEKLEFKFCIGLAYFASGDKQKTLKLWREILPDEEKFFTLTAVDLDCSIFKWDIEKISTEKIRLWIQDEYDEIRSIGASGDSESDRKKKHITRMFRLMLGLVQPRCHDNTSGPYCAASTFSLPPNVQRVLCS